jgi:hypothetical protein
MLVPSERTFTSLVYNVCWLQVYELENALDQSVGLQASVNAAVQRAVGPAVNAALGPVNAAIAALNATMVQVNNTMTQNQLALTTLMARSDNADIRRLNSHQVRAAVQGAAIPLRMPVKETGGNIGIPADPALANLAVPVAIGTALPVDQLGFQLAHRSDIIGLMHQNLDDLEWFYGVPFGGAGLADRIDMFLSFVGL